MRTESAQRGETGARRKTVFRFRSAISRAVATILKGTASSLLTDKPIFNKRLIFADEFRQRVCQMPGGRPGVRKCPAPGAAIKLRMPHRRDGQREQMPRGCPRGGKGTAGLD